MLVVALLLLLNDEGIKGGGNDEVVVKPTLFVELNCSSVGGFMRLANGFWARGAVEPNGFKLAFGCVTSLSRLTRLQKSSPRKLSGVLRAIDGSGLGLFELEFNPEELLGLRIEPPMVKPLLGGEIEPDWSIWLDETGNVDEGIFQGFDEPCCCCCCWGEVVEISEIYTHT